jgi:hypothetical protein
MMTGGLSPFALSAPSRETKKAGAPAPAWTKIKLDSRLRKDGTRPI